MWRLLGWLLLCEVLSQRENVHFLDTYLFLRGKIPKFEVMKESKQNFEADEKVTRHSDRTRESEVNSLAASTK